MQKPIAFRSATPLALTALTLYIIGGIATFSGLFISIRRWFVAGSSGLADGVLLVALGVTLSIAGVLFMRIVRNRWRR